jgi:hypothetical protein
MTPDEQKELYKQAIKEWMDETASEIGWWFLRTMAMGAVAYIIYFWVMVRGYRFP